jgi:XTP/dITP diphosphohydrolase
MLRGPFLFATRNRGKLAEVSTIAAQLNIAIVGLEEVSRSVGCTAPEVPETGSTYEANAVLKARRYAVWAGVTALSDDSGLEVEQLRGLPGVYTAHYGVARVFAELTPGVQYRARFRSCMALAEPGGRVVAVTAALDGTLIVPPESAIVVDTSLPYSSFFYPENESRSLSVLMRQGAGFPSHRMKALVKLFEAIGESSLCPAQSI